MHCLYVTQSDYRNLYVSFSCFVFAGLALVASDGFVSTCLPRPAAGTDEIDLFASLSKLPFLHVTLRPNPNMENEANRGSSPVCGQEEILICSVQPPNVGRDRCRLPSNSRVASTQELFSKMWYFCTYAPRLDISLEKCHDLQIFT